MSNPRAVPSRATSLQSPRLEAGFPCPLLRVKRTSPIRALVCLPMTLSGHETDRLSHRSDRSATASETRRHVRYGHLADLWKDRHLPTSGLTDARSRSPVLLWPLAGSRRPRRHVGFRRSTLRNHVLRRQNSRLEQKAGDARADQRCDDEQPNLSERMRIGSRATMAGPSERAGLTEVPVTLIPSR